MNKEYADRRCLTAHCRVRVYFSGFVFGLGLNHGMRRRRRGLCGEWEGGSFVYNWTDSLIGGGGLGVGRRSMEMP